MIPARANELSAWACPALVAAYSALGIQTLHPWQRACLQLPGVFPYSQGRSNLLFSAPTSGGKSLVAELIALANIVSQEGECLRVDALTSSLPVALIILPYVALVEEKAAALSRLLHATSPELKLKVSAIHGRKGNSNLDSTCSIVVCTPERASAVVDALMTSKTLSRLRCVVVDEIHHVGEPARGAILEALLTKLMFSSVGATTSTVQIVGMSATVPNLSELAKWLCAVTFESSERPTHLAEYICVEGGIRRVNGMSAPTLAPSAAGSSTSLFSPFPLVTPMLTPSRGDYRAALIVPLTAETAATGGQVLLFAPDRRSVQELAQLLRCQLAGEVRRLQRVLLSSQASKWEPGALAAAATNLASTVHPPPAFATTTARLDTAPQVAPLGKVQRLRLQAMSQLQSLIGESGTLGDPVLASVVREMTALVREGVGYHHAGLPQSVRSIIEFAFKVGALSALVCTSTLAAGINLPARRVLIYGLHVGRDLLPLAQYRQMVGRAGRTGFDPYGESILCLPPTAPAPSLVHAKALVSQALPPVCSSLLRPIDRGDDLVMRAALRLPTHQGTATPSNASMASIGKDISSIAAAVDAGHAAGMAKMLLEAVDIGLTTSPSHVFLLAMRTLLFVQIGEESLRILVGGCLAFMLALHVNMIEATALVTGTVTGASWIIDCVVNEPGVFRHASIALRTTQKGRAAVAVRLSPFEALILYNDLACTRKQLILTAPLHALYCCVPISPMFEPPWRGGSGESEVLSVHRLWESHMLARCPTLGDLARLVVPADVEGQRLFRVNVPILEFSFLSEARSVLDGAKSTALKRASILVGAHSASEDAVGRVATLMHVRARRIFGAWLLHEFICNPHPWCESSGMEPAMNMHEPRRVGFRRLEDLLGLVGLVPDAMEKIVEESASFASNVVAFCTQLAWHQLAKSISDARDSLRKKYPPSLRLFSHMPAMTRSRAEALHSAGIESLTALAAADLPFVKGALLAALPLDTPPWPTERSIESPVTVRRLDINSTGSEREAIAASTILASARRFLTERAAAQPAGIAAMIGSRLGRCIPASLQGLGIQFAKRRVRQLQIISSAFVCSDMNTSKREGTRPDVLHPSTAVHASSSQGGVSIAGAAALTSLANVAGVGDVEEPSYDEDAESLFHPDSENSSVDLLDDAESLTSTSSNYSCGDLTADDAEQNESWLDVHDTLPTSTTSQDSVVAGTRFTTTAALPVSSGGRTHLVHHQPSDLPTTGAASDPSTRGADQKLSTDVANSRLRSCELDEFEPDMLHNALEATPLKSNFVPAEPFVPCLQPVISQQQDRGFRTTAGRATAGRLHVSSSVLHLGASALLPSNEASVATLLAGRSAAPRLSLLRLPRAVEGTFTVMAPIGILESKESVFRPPTTNVATKPITLLPQYVMQAARVQDPATIGDDTDLFIASHFDVASQRLVRLASGSTDSVLSIVPLLGVPPPWCSMSHNPILLGIGISRGPHAGLCGYINVAPAPPPPLESWRGLRSLGRTTVKGASRHLHAALLHVMVFLGVGCVFSDVSRRVGSDCSDGAPITGRCAVAAVCRAFYAAYIDTVRLVDDMTMKKPRQALKSALTHSRVVIVPLAHVALQYLRSADYSFESEVADPLVAAWLVDPEAGAASESCVVGNGPFNDKESPMDELLARLQTCSDRFLSGTEFERSVVARKLCIDSSDIPYLQFSNVNSGTILSECTSFLAASKSELFSRDASPTQRRKTCAAAAIAHAAMLTLGTRLHGASLLQPFRFVEMPMIRLLANMMQRGVCADHKVLTHYVLHVSERLQVLQQAMKEMCLSFVGVDGGSFDPRRATDIASVLFLQFRITPPVDSGLASLDALCADPLLSAGVTSSESLSVVRRSTVGVAATFIDLLLEFRDLSMILQRTLRPLRKQIRGDPSLGNLRASGLGTIRAVLDYQTATGRLSCSHPNLQALPKAPIEVKCVGRPSLFDELTRTDGLVWVRNRGDTRSVVLRSGGPPGLTRVPLEEALRHPFQSRCIVVLAKQSQLASAANARAKATDALLVAGSVHPSGSINAPVPISVIRTRFGHIVAVHHTTNLAKPPISGRLPNQHSVVVSESRHEAVSSETSVADYWRAQGFAYSDIAAQETTQVTVLCQQRPVSSDAVQSIDPDKDATADSQAAFCYPADKVYRLAAPIFLPEVLPPGGPCNQQPWSTPLSMTVRNVICARPGFALLAADYAQIEVRILAHLSEDAALLSVIRSREDVFTGIASVWLNRADATSVTSEERNKVKQLVYALLYGASTTAFSAALGISQLEATQHIDAFRRSFPGVFSFLKCTVEYCKKTGYVDTICGRRRHLPLIAGTDAAQSGQVMRRAARQAINTTCQGSAADIIKLAAVNITSALEVAFGCDLPSQIMDRGLGSAAVIPSATAEQTRPVQDVAHIILQVHDELVLEVRKEHLHEVAALVRHCMEHVITLKVPLAVALASGERYGSLAKISQLPQAPLYENVSEAEAMHVSAEQLVTGKRRRSDSASGGMHTA